MCVNGCLNVLVLCTFRENRSDLHFKFTIIWDLELGPTFFVHFVWDLGIIEISIENFILSNWCYFFTGSLARFMDSSWWVKVVIHQLRGIGGFCDDCISIKHFTDQRSERFRSGKHLAWSTQLFPSDLIGSVSWGSMWCMYWFPSVS